MQHNHQCQKDNVGREVAGHQIGRAALSLALFVGHLTQLVLVTRPAADESMRQSLVHHSVTMRHVEIPVCSLEEWRVEDMHAQQKLTPQSSLCPTSS